ncbi:hypothetical protein RJ55_07836 [Drechmeria coniospora]|nr:hypothetical protein RJ55_07836 [Drechmeria coniospora]
MATSNTPAGAEENIVSDLGFARVKSARSTYGRKKPSSQEVAKDRRAVMASKATLQVPAMPESPEKAETSRRRLLLPSQPAPMSPKRMGAKLVTERQDDEVIGTILSSPKKAKPVLNQIPLLESPLPSGKLITKTWPRKKRVEAPRSPTPPRAVFKMPAQFADLGDCAGDAKDGPGVVLDDNSSDARNEEKSDSEPVDEVAQKSVASTLPVCPWCNEPVDRVLLAEFSKGKRMNVRQQSRFCHKHRKQTAKTIWQERDYPNVDWDHLERRFSEHRSSLLEIVNGKPSHFRAVLAGKIASGQARSMKKEENLNPGYYGPRGFNLMCDYLVDEFGSLLKEKAVDDRVIAGRGSAAFIQSVLVAELAVHLIRDDMRVSDEEARVILEESRALGEIVHEEE